MQPDDCFTLRARRSTLRAAVSLGNRHARPAGEHADGFGETQLVMQLDEFHHVAADATAETLEESFVGFTLNDGVFSW